MRSMATATSAHVTPEEYLERERKAEFRSEYFGGEIVAMAGGTYEHSIIIGNVIRELSQGLRRVNCTVSSSDVRLAIASAGFYTYPDVMVVCGDPAFVDNRRDTVCNPVLLIEVLSESTKDYDRGDKFQSYRTLSSLKEYVTVAQDKMHVEQHVRQSDDRWLLTDYWESAGRIQLASVALELQLSDIYEKIVIEKK